MTFIFIDEEDETLDLSDVFSEPEEESGFYFTDKIPKAKSITDTEVRSKAQKARKRNVRNSSYQVKRDEGWSLYCAHPKHLPTLCEGDLDEHKISCTCPCHAERGYIQPGPEQLPGSDEREILLSID